MPGYNAHEYFGEQVVSHLPEPLRTLAIGDPYAFRAGTYGPDPIMFCPLPKVHGQARILHREWNRNVKVLREMLRSGNATSQSFAAGYLCHVWLDDTCHPYIMQLVREKRMSHFFLEVGLDRQVLDELQYKRFPIPKIQERKAIGRAAFRLLPQVRPWQYRLGLWAMMATCVISYWTGSLLVLGVRRRYYGEVEELRRLTETAVSHSADELAELLSP